MTSVTQGDFKRRKGKIKTQNLGLKNKDLNQNFLEMICVEEEMWICHSFSDLESATWRDNSCVFSGCFIFESNKCKHELAILKQTKGWFI